MENELSYFELITIQVNLPKMPLPDIAELLGRSKEDLQEYLDTILRDRDHPLLPVVKAAFRKKEKQPKPPKQKPVKEKKPINDRPAQKRGVFTAPREHDRVYATREQDLSGMRLVRIDARTSIWISKDQDEAAEIAKFIALHTKIPTEKDIAEKEKRHQIRLKKERTALEHKRRETIRLTRKKAQYPDYFQL